MTHHRTRFVIDTRSRLGHGEHRHFRELFKLSNAADSDPVPLFLSRCFVVNPHFGVFLDVGLLQFLQLFLYSPLGISANLVDLFEDFAGLFIRFELDHVIVQLFVHFLC